jgi:hypothetical protein
VPERTPPVERVKPEGRAPVSENVGAGEPVAVTVKDPDPPTVNVVLFALVMRGVWPTVNVKLWVATDPTPFEAEIVMG